MDSIKDRVAIVGMGCVKFGENWNQSLEDMFISAVGWQELIQPEDRSWLGA